MVGIEDFVHLAARDGGSRDRHGAGPGARDGGGLDWWCRHGSRQYLQCADTTGAGPSRPLHLKESKGQRMGHRPSAAQALIRAASVFHLISARRNRL